MKTGAEMQELGRVGDSDSQPRLVGQSLFEGVERQASRFVAFSARGFGDTTNPLLNLGALSNYMLLVATISGIILLFWYTPSHTGAYASVEAMADSPLTAGLMRSLHRYSSDAALMLAFFHGLQMLVQRRLLGPRRLAWVTGMLAVAFLWLVGWLGYWLVWDERAQAVAVGTAKMLDVLPIFTDPVSRSFLTDGDVSSLLFFVVFFVHMLLPFLMVISLWVHLSRLSRPRWLPGRTLGYLAFATLVVLSLVWPATSAGPASMAKTPAPDSIDAWYLLPVYLTERLSGGMLWVVGFAVGLLVLMAPWWLVRKRASRPGEVAGTDLSRAPVAVVDPARCNGCETCHKDCPYDAISMVARTDGRHFPSVALVDPDRCVGCGICAGSCDSAGVGPVWPRQVVERHRADDWLAAGEAKVVVYACARSAAAGLEVDNDGRWVGAENTTRVISVPCAGWVHPLTLERSVRRGAERVVVVSCRPQTCGYREGALWTADRVAGRREPALRRDHAEGRVEYLALDLHEESALKLALSGHSTVQARSAEHTHDAARAIPRRPGLRGLWVWTVIVLGGLLLLWAPTELPYHAPEHPPQLVLSLRAAGQAEKRCRVRTAEELAALPPHKRVAEVCERERSGLRLVVRVDGALIVDETHEPGGAFGDGMTTVVRTVPVDVGDRVVEVELGSVGETGWHKETRMRRTFTPGRRLVLAFDALDGFRWH